MAKLLEENRTMYRLLCAILEREDTSENWNACRLRDEIKKAKQRLSRCPGGRESLRLVEAECVKRGKKVRCREFECEAQVNGYVTFYLTTTDRRWTESRLRHALSSGRARFDLETQRIYLNKTGRRVGAVRMVADELSFDSWAVEEMGF